MSGDKAPCAQGGGEQHAQGTDHHPARQRARRAASAARETLWFGNNNWASVYATNSSMALNAGTWGSVAHSTAQQAISVHQH